jgi:hypothetical protein
MVMLWPLPTRGAHVKLACTCQATVVWWVPVVFAYRVRIDWKGGDCGRVWHVPGQRVFTWFESMTHRLP